MQKYYEIFKFHSYFVRVEFKEPVSQKDLTWGHIYETSYIFKVPLLKEGEKSPLVRWPLKCYSLNLLCGFLTKGDLK